MRTEIELTPTKSLSTQCIAEVEILNKENNDLSCLEILTSLALPMNSQRMVTKIVQNDGSMTEIDISATSSRGEVLTSRHHNVINALFNFLIDEYINESQKKGDRLNFKDFSIDKIYPSNIDIIRLCNLSADSNSWINKILEELKDIKMKTIERSWTASNKSFIPRQNEGAIIQNIAQVSVTKKVGTKFITAAAREIRLHPFFMKQAKETCFFLVRNDHIRKLSGKEKRLYIYLLARKAILGNKFAVDAESIADMLSINNEKRMRELIQREMIKLQEKIVGIDFEFTRDRTPEGFKKLQMIVDFDPKDEVKVDTFDYFKSYYSEEFLDQDDIQLSKFNYQNLISEASRFCEKEEIQLTISLDGKKQISTIDYVLDIALFQVKKGNAIKKSFKAFVMTLLKLYKTNEMNIPSGYKKFVIDRVLDIEKEKTEENNRLLLIAKRKKEEEDQAKLHQSFLVQFNFLMETDPEFLKIITQKAIDSITSNSSEPWDSNSPFYDMAIQAEIPIVAKKMFLAGDMYAHKKFEKADIQLGYQHRELTKLGVDPLNAALDFIQ